MVFNENVQMLKRGREAALGVSAITGRLQSDGVTYANAADTNPNKVWVTLENRQERLVWNNGKFIVNTRYSGVAVRISQTAENGTEWEICAGDAQKSDIRHGGMASTVLSAQRSLEAAGELLPGTGFKPGRAKIWVSGTLKVNLDPFWYDDSSGDPHYWKPPSLEVDDGSCLDLSGNVPAASGGVDQVRWVVVAFDVDAVPADALVAINGTAQSTSLPALSKTAIADITITAGLIPVWAFRLTTGDSEESDVPLEYDQEDIRRHMGSGGGTAWSGYHLVPIFDSNGDVVVNASNEPYVTRYYK